MNFITEITLAATATTVLLLLHTAVSQCMYKNISVQPTRSPNVKFLDYCWSTQCYLFYYENYCYCRLPSNFC